MLLLINDNIPTEKREYNILLVTLIFNIYFFNEMKKVTNKKQLFIFSSP